MSDETKVSLSSGAFFLLMALIFSLWYVGSSVNSASKILESIEASLKNQPVAEAKP